MCAGLRGLNFLATPRVDVDGTMVMMSSVDDERWSQVLRWTGVALDGCVCAALPNTHKKDQHARSPNPTRCTSDPSPPAHVTKYQGSVLAPNS